MINSGNANAATGEEGMANAKRTAERAARLLGCRAEQVLVASTGIIGHQLPMEKLDAGLEHAVAGLSPDPSGFLAAARAIMTTDTRPKIVSERRSIAGKDVTLLGIAKGAAMIGPRMATMLAFLLTDAPRPAYDLREILADAVDSSFNCLSVEGHASTNDTVLLISSTAAEERLCAARTWRRSPRWSARPASRWPGRSPTTARAPRTSSRSMSPAAGRPRMPGPSHAPSPRARW